MAHGAEAMAQGKDALVVLDGFEPLVDLWTRSTSILAERFGAENVGLGDDSECRAFFSAVLQRAGNMQGGGSLTVVALTADEPPPEEEVLSTESYTLDQFRAAGARKSIMDRLEALDARGIAITDDILGKIGVAAPNTNKRPDAPGTKRRSEACEMLTSIGDAHVEVMRNEKGVCDVDASASLQRVGVGADVGTDTRPPALVTLGVGNRLRLELAAATNVERERVNEEEAADEQALVRAAAWRAALRVGADDPPRSLSSVCGVAVAVQQGLFDGVSAEDASVKVDKLLAALPETSVDATKALSDADLSALKAAAVGASAARYVTHQSLRWLARVDQRRPVVRVRQCHRVSHDHEPPLGARERHVEAPRVAHEAERAFLVRASGREDHNVRLLALKRVDAAHAHALDAGASQRSTHLTNLLGVGTEDHDVPLLFSEKLRHDVHNNLGLGRVRKPGLVFRFLPFKVEKRQRQPPHRPHETARKQHPPQNAVGALYHASVEVLGGEFDKRGRHAVLHVERLQLNTAPLEALHRRAAELMP